MIEVRWFLADGTPADPADPQVRDLIRRTLEESLQTCSPEAAA